MKTFVNKMELGFSLLPVYAFHILASGTAFFVSCMGKGVLYALSSWVKTREFATASSTAFPVIHVRINGSSIFQMP